MVAYELQDIGDTHLFDQSIERIECEFRDPHVCGMSSSSSSSSSYVSTCGQCAPLSSTTSPRFDESLSSSTLLSVSGPSSSTFLPTSGPSSSSSNIIRKNQPISDNIAVFNRSNNKGGTKSHKKVNDGKLKNTARELKSSNPSDIDFLYQHGSLELFTQSFGPLESKVLKRFVLAMAGAHEIANVDPKTIDKNLLQKVSTIITFSSVTAYYITLL